MSAKRTFCCITIYGVNSITNDPKNDTVERTTCNASNDLAIAIKKCF